MFFDIEGGFMKGISGWLLLYLVGSVPVILFYAVGLAGRFFDYHLGVVAGVFFVLVLPLLLIVLGVESAPAWNIASLWIGAGSITLILLVGALTADAGRFKEAAATMAIIALASNAWAAVWTVYFLKYYRVVTTFT